MDFATIGGIIIMVILPMSGWVLRLQGRLVALETWREALADRLDGFEGRVLDTLARIENRLDALADRAPHR